MTISPADLLPADAYARCRAAHRARCIAHRRSRTVDFGPHMRIAFEDEATVRYQIQEALWMDDIRETAAIEREIAPYARLVPAAGEWTASLLIEIPDAGERRRRLPALSVAVHRLYAACDGPAPAFAQANEDLADRHLSRPSGVHFLRFAPTAAMRAAVLAGGAITLGCADAAYPLRCVVPADTARQLRAALAALPEREGDRTARAVPAPATG